MDGTVHIVTLNQRPCVVQYLDEFNKFIVGTYELYPTIEEARLRLGAHLEEHQLKKRLERINHRAGKLILLRGNDVSVPSIEYEFDCHSGGGIFDTKVRYNSSDSSYSIYAAHSNGTIGIYKLCLHCGNKICLKGHINVPDSKMLTSIDIFPIESGLATTQQPLSPLSNIDSATRIKSSAFLSSKLVVGDSKGFVTVFSRGEIIRENVARGDSIWQVKSLRLASDRDVVFVGAENCAWYIYALDEYAKKLILLYKNEFKDFTAGVTCVSILEVAQLVEYDLVEILLGSYDETLQAYQVKINHDGLSKPGVCHKNTISIHNGGIWRVKPLKGNKKRQLCIAAMYAGSYILSLDGPGISTAADQPKQQLANETLSRLVDADSLKLAHKPLHYDIDVSSCNTTYCVVDFNNSLCLFKTIDQ